MSNYSTARTIFGILEFIAWVAVVGGFVLAVQGSGAGSYILKAALG